jgi:ribosomal protein S18 acetylase RimI-like enzyme
MMVSADNDSRRAGTIWTLSLEEPTPAIMPLTPATFYRVEPQSALELAEAMGGDGLAEVSKRFETGRRCYAARVEGRLVAYGWVSFEEEFIGELSLRLRLLPGEAYIWNCVTLPTFRRNLLYSALLVNIVRELQKEQLSRVWIGADFDNMASQRGIARAGFTCVADLRVARVLTLRQVWVQGRPGMPDRLVEEARRVFLNNRDKVWLSALTTVKSV